VKKKDEEMKRIKRVNETLKSLVKGSVTDAKGNTTSITVTKKEVHKKSFTATGNAEMIKSTVHASDLMT
jgi:hypothetical protein